MFQELSINFLQQFKTGAAPINASASSAVGAGAELCAPLTKLFEATGGAAPLVCSNLVAVLALSLLLGNHNERRKDAIKALTINEGFEQVFDTMSFRHICKTMRTCAYALPRFPTLAVTALSNNQRFHPPFQ